MRYNIVMMTGGSSFKYAVAAFFFSLGLAVAAGAQEPTPEIQSEIDRILREALQGEQGGLVPDLVPEPDADLNPANKPAAPAILAPQKAPTIDDWFAELADPEFAGWARAQADIEREWSKSGSASADLLLQRGQMALDEGDLAGAVEDLSALVDHAPAFATGRVARAEAYYLTDQVGPALEDLRAALQAEPRQFVALALLGRICDETGDSARALTAYRASLALNPHQTDVQDEIARIEKARAGRAI